MLRRFLTLAVVAFTATASLAAEPADRPLAQVIDRHIDAELQKANVKPAPPADDATLLRRLTLDLVGRIPAPAETAEYVASTDPDKKARAVDRLMASPGFARHQGQEFFTLMYAEGKVKKGQPKGDFRQYLQTSLAENKPWDRVFREVLLPEETRAPGAEDFLRSRIKDLDRLTVDVSIVFFGVNVSCAQCHDHPHVTDWTQDHFYGMKSFFARTFEAGATLGESDFGAVKYIPNKGKEKLAPVMFLTGKAIEAPNLREPTAEEKRKTQKVAEAAKKGNQTPPRPQFSLRAKLVETALEPGQRDFFARNLVNRLWHRFHGRGLVMPLDQMHSANPPSHPELLADLARDLVEHGYDVRRLIRGLILSNTYARDSRIEGDNPPAEKLFAVAKVRPLTPMQMAAALKLAALNPELLPSDRAALEQRLEALMKGAANLAGLFAQPGDNYQVGVSEAMLFANNEGLQKDLLEGSGSLVARLRQVPDLEKRADLAVRSVLSRPGRPEEVAALADYMRRRQDRPEDACRQAVWALLASAEFRFNH